MIIYLRIKYTIQLLQRFDGSRSRVMGGNAWKRLRSTQTPTKFMRNSHKIPDQTSYFVASGLGLHCLFTVCSGLFIPKLKSFLTVKVKPILLPVDIALFSINKYMY